MTSAIPAAPAVPVQRRALAKARVLLRQYLRQVSLKQVRLLKGNHWHTLR